MTNAKKVVSILREKGIFITTVESCTGGGLINAITNISGASEVTNGARVTYSNEEKIALGVPAKTIEKYTVYSQEVALAMAEAGIRASVRADIGVGITGSFSRVDPANPLNSRPGEFHIGVKYGDVRLSRTFTFPDESSERSKMKEWAIDQALSMILEAING